MTKQPIDQLIAIADATAYIARHGPDFVAGLREGNFSAIAATDLKAQADRLSRNIGAVALALATNEAASKS